jgi:NAD(P)H-hydrate epimerase
MLLAGAAQMREADRRAQEMGLSGLILMENAAQGAARAASRLLLRAGFSLQGSEIAAFCGRGNNGGDAIACARILANQGARALLVLLNPARDLSPESKINLDIAVRCGLQVIDAPEDWACLSPLLKNCRLIIDGLVGTGFTAPLRPRQQQAADFINDSGIPVLSLDMPSGQDADSGQAQGAVRAALTVTFACLKLGLALNPPGEVEIIDIGLPPAALSHISGAALSQPEELRNWLPPRGRSSHKGNLGHVFILGGSPGKTGALILAARGAQASGAGLVSAALGHSLQNIAAAALSGPMTVSLPQNFSQGLSREALAVILEQPAGAWVAGPGLGRDGESWEMLRAWLRQNRLPLLLDADALNALAPLGQGQIKAAASTLLTPHPGEAGRLLGCATAQVQADRLGAAREIAARSGAVCLLKGAASVLAGPEGEILINPSGNDLLATGGSGDVLAGLAGGLLAQGLSPWRAGAMAAYIHGRAADLARAEGISRGWPVESLPSYIVKAWGELEKNGNGLCRKAGDGRPYFYCKHPAR